MGKGDELIGGIDLVCSLNRTYIPANKEQELFLKIEITPTEIITEFLPLDVCLLIDRSSSMAGKRLDNVKEGAVNLITQLESRDYAAIVTFESKIDIVVPAQRVADKSMFEKKIREIEAGNTTEMYEGLKTAFLESKKSLKINQDPKKEPLRRIILFSGSQPTDNHPESAYRDLAREIGGVGISITALGIGRNYNEDLISALVEETGGVWYHISSPDEISDICSPKVSNMGTDIYSQTELIVNLSKGFEIVDICKSTPDEHRTLDITRINGEYRISIRDIKARECQTFVARIAALPRSQGKHKIAQVIIKSGTFSRTEDVIVQYIEDEFLSFEYDIAISFADEDRKIAEHLAEELRNEGVNVFYDKFYKSELWGKELTKYFRDVYGSRSRFAVLLISEHYPVKDWTDFEFSIMRAEAKKRKSEFILPVKLDDTKMLGIHENVGYLDYREERIEGIVNSLLEKLGIRRKNQSRN